MRFSQNVCWLDVKAPGDVSTGGAVSVWAVDGNGSLALDVLSAGEVEEFVENLGRGPVENDWTHEWEVCFWAMESKRELKEPILIQKLSTALAPID